MKVEATNQNTREKIILEVNDITSESLKYLSKDYLSKKEIKNYIDNTCFSPEIKSMLWTVAEISINISNTVINIGRRIIELIVFFARSYPNTSIGVIVGSIIGISVTAIPLIGFLIGWLLQPLCIALGLGIGFWKDMEDKRFSSKLASAVKETFGGIAGANPKSKCV